MSPEPDRPPYALRRVALEHPFGYAAALSSALFTVVYDIGSSAGMSSAAAVVIAAVPAVMFGVGFAWFLHWSGTRRRLVSSQDPASDAPAIPQDPSSFTGWVMRHPAAWGLIVGSLTFLVVAVASEGRFALALAIAMPLGAVNAWIWRPGGFGARARARVLEAERGNAGPGS